MSPSDEPNPYAPSQVAGELEAVCDGGRPLERVVDDFRSARIALATILGLSGAVWLLIALVVGGLTAFYAVVPGGLAIGYARCWKPAIQAGAVLTATVAIPLIVYSIVGIILFPLVAVLIALPATAVMYLAGKCLHFAHEILEAGYPLTVTSLEIINAQTTESSDSSG